MKKSYSIIIAILITTSVFSQAPEKMSYQAVVRDASDALVTNASIGIQISILQGSTIGTAVYVETQTPTTNINGLLSLEIGTGTIVSGDFTAIDWTSNIYFIKTEIDLAGGTTYTITGTSQLLSVPYALHSKTTESIAGTVAIANGGTGATNATTAFDVLSPLTTEGDIIYGGASGTGTVLPKGTANQVLTMNAGATAPIWSTSTAASINGLSDGKTTSSSVFLGYRSGQSDNLTSTNENTGLGIDALRTNDTGQKNTAIGYRALYLNSSGAPAGDYNTAVGSSSLIANTSGGYNTALGAWSLKANITGTNNTALGALALSKATGSSNVALGANALYNNVTGAGNIAIGNSAGYNETGSNKLYIDNSNTTTPLIYGDFGANLVTINGVLNIRDGNSGVGAALSFYEATSSGTDKIIIQAPPTLTGGTYGLLLPDRAGLKGEVLQLQNGLGYLGWKNLDHKSIFVLTFAINYPIMDSDTYIICTADGTSVTLPTAVGVAGKEYIIKNMAATNVTISTTSSQQIWQDATNKTTTATLGVTTQNNWIKVISDGTNWISFRALY